MFRTAFRPLTGCSPVTIGLAPSRQFTSSSPSLLKQLPNRAQPRTAAIAFRQRPFLITSITATAFAFPYLTSSTTIRHDSSPDFSTSPYTHSKDAKVPISKDGGRSLNPAAIRQISFGGLLGLGLGVLVSAFSKMLVLFLGIGIVASQYAARKGYNILPVNRLQKYVKGVNLRSAINDNAAFKISFGLMFALTAFGEL